ncbi:MAG: DMT family transporter [Cyanobacteria bacterium J06641_5]
MKTTLLTSLALLAFAANSLLTRLALGAGAIDAASFMAIRLFAGAAMLCGLVGISRGSDGFNARGDWLAALMLFLYAALFSFAYLQLDSGTGALILFGTVQATMLLAALRQGETPNILEWLGLLFALGGLTYLVLPGLSAPPILGSGLMVGSGIAWGIYSLLGRGAQAPIVNTMANFLRSLPFAIGAFLFTLPSVQLSPRGIILASISGAITSGVGYVLWYAALKQLTATRAAMVQLAVPILAAMGGIIFLQEIFSARLAIASFAILAGIGLAILGRQH